MGCNCGKRRQTIDPSQAAALASQAQVRGQATYTITAPDGSQETFTDYQLAATHRRAVNGVLTTTS